MNGREQFLSKLKYIDNEREKNIIKINQLEQKKQIIKEKMINSTKKHTRDLRLNIAPIIIFDILYALQWFAPGVITEFNHLVNSVLPFTFEVNHTVLFISTSLCLSSTIRNHRKLEKYYQQQKSNYENQVKKYDREIDDSLDYQNHLNYEKIDVSSHLFRLSLLEEKVQKKQAYTNLRNILLKLKETKEISTEYTKKYIKK